MEVINSNTSTMTKIKEEVFSIVDSIDIKEEPIDKTNVTNDDVDKIVKIKITKSRDFKVDKGEPIRESENDRHGNTPPNKALKTEYIEYLVNSDHKYHKKRESMPVNKALINDERMRHTWIIIEKELFIFEILNEEGNWYFKCQRMKNESRSERRKISKTQAHDFIATINNRKKLQRSVHKLANFVSELPDTATLPAFSFKTLQKCKCKGKSNRSKK